MDGELTNKVLARKIENRRKFLEKTVDTVIELVEKRGALLKQDMHRFHTNTISELRDFGNFTFHTDLGQSEMGGNTVKIFYHPKKRFRQGGLESAWDREWVPVLDVSFWIGNDYKVSAFNEDPDWQKTLIHVLKNKDKIAVRMAARAEKQREKKRAKKSKTETSREQLLTEAKRLGFTTQ